MPSAQSKPDANKADDASPFALLVGSAQAKPAAQQPATQQKDTRAKDSQNSGEKQKDASGPRQADSATASAKDTSPVQAKSAKADKSDDKNSKDKSSDSGDSSQLSANLQQIDPQTLPAVPMSAQQLPSLTAAHAAITGGDDDADQDQPAVSAAGAAGVAASGQAKTQAGQSAQTPNQTAAAQDPAQANGLAEDQTASQASNQVGAQPAGQAASQPSPQSTNQAATQPAPQSTDQTATDQAAAQPAPQSTSQTATPPVKAKAQASSANQDPAQQAATQPDGVQQPAKPWQAKNQTVADANAGKTDAGKTDAGKTDTSQTAKADDVKPAVAPAPQAVATTDAQAPKQDATLGSVLPATGGSQTQATQGNTAPAVTQNVHVSTPTPNMPALAVEIAAKSLGGAKQFDIRLDPPELGRVEVRLSIDATGKASAHLSADQPQTLDLLQKDAPSLTRALRDAGLDVSQNGLNFSLRQQAGDGGAGQGQNFGNGRAFTLSATSSIDASQASAAYSASANGRLDIRV